jgi:hypothetical protein
MTLPNNAPLYVPVIEAWLKKLHYFSEKHTQDVLFSPKFLQNLYVFRGFAAAQLILELQILRVNTVGVKPQSKKFL